MRLIENHLARQIAGAHRVIKSFASDWIDKAAGIANREPSIARHAIRFPPWRFERRKHVPIKWSALEADRLFAHVLLKARAQGAGRLALSTNADRQMSAAREYPDVAFELRQKLDIDVIALARDVVTESKHRVGRAIFGADIAQRIAGARGDDAEIGLERAVTRVKPPALSATLHASDAGLLNLRARLLRAIQ